MEIILKMEDLTDILLQNDGSFLALEEVPDVSADTAVIKVTAQMLHRRPDIKQVLLDQLADFIIEWDNLQSVTEEQASELTEEEKQEVVQKFTDEQLINALNSDPFVQGAVVECLTELTDCIDNEGEPNYTPSIFDTDDAGVLSTYIKYGLREDGDNEFIPAKYADLSEESLDVIYSNPECRKITSKFKGPLTDRVVKAFLKD